MSACPYPARYCECGDLLIHNGARGANESSSAFGQHIHDDYGKEFYWADVDGVIYKMANKIMRVIEHKPLGAPVKPSQRSILPLLAIGIDTLVKVHYLNPQSGAFIVWSAPPFGTGSVARVRADTSYELTNVLDLDVPRFDRFKQGLPVPPARPRDGAT